MLMALHSGIRPCCSTASRKLARSAKRGIILTDQPSARLPMGLRAPPRTDSTEAYGIIGSRESRESRRYILTLVHHLDAMPTNTCTVHAQEESSRSGSGSSGRFAELPPPHLVWTAPNRDCQKSHSGLASALLYLRLYLPLTACSPFNAFPGRTQPGEADFAL
ncbi:hypothetical protein BCR34DRAFT_116199 [Clohesyomyces aquaticus]|uniref:Uncharacterized protein n=1 Tax=Clohesyomyces aquaticus TaxID=1231657 RepID=A0A1Y1YQB2_9PLEO|nr:hypothetical protein BCR34DRAFT_116199 [Clohesyomyces aquaticus]